MDEYLWNKTGSDPEIERIEVALEGLAYRPTAPPELPAKQLVLTRRRPFFRLGFSFAATLLALIAFGSGWFLLRNDRPAAQQTAAKTAPGRSVIPATTETDVSAVPEPPKVSAPSKSKRRVAAARSVRSIAIRPNTIRPQTLVLTKEEADAYRQLMTALSITSANLKIVKDKIGGTE